jgi:hypothetical protein
MSIPFNIVDSNVSIFGLHFREEKNLEEILENFVNKFNVFKKLDIFNFWIFNAVLCFVSPSRLSIT